MKSTLFGTAVLVVLTATAPAAGELYKVTVTRVDKDLYRVDSSNPKVYVETKFCFEFATRVEAVLKYDQYSYNNKLIFDSGTSCDVKSVR